MSSRNINKGLILYNCFSNNQIPTVERYFDEFKKAGVDITIKRNNELKTMINSDGGFESVYKGYDFCLFYDQDEYVGRILEKIGIRLFNPIKSIINCADKVLTHIELANNGIKMPKTIPGHICYTDNAHYSDITLHNIIESLGLPLVFKLCYGSKGDNVFLVNSFDELKMFANEYIYQKHLFQEYVEESSGEDIRVIVIGHKVVGAMLRKNENDFRSNLSKNGTGYPYELPDAAKEIAIKASKIMELDYCGLDLMKKNNNEFLLCEINSNAFITGFEKVTGINVAKIYVDYILSVVNNSEETL